MKRRSSALFIAMLLTISMTSSVYAEGKTSNNDDAKLVDAGIETEEPTVTEPCWEEDGGRHLVNADGTAVSGWYKDDKNWLYLDSDGYPQTGWQKVNGKWYYLDSNGIMLDGWQKINGSWYLFSGGAMKTGWAKSGGKWYYLSDSGAMKTGWLTLGNKKYYLTSSGAMKTGSITEGNTVYTLSSSGSVSDSKNLSSVQNKSIGWGVGTQVDSQNRPISAVTYQAKYGDEGGVFIGENRNVIYLTFDEGYENGYTPAILDTLKEKGVKATFFITGAYLKSNGALVKRMIDEGHTVGNHTVNHVNLPSVSISKRTDEIEDLHQQVEEKFGYTMYLMRPPEGVFSEQVLSQAQGMGYKTVLWSFAYKDWDVNNQMSASTALSKASSALHPGAVYLLHAVSKTNAEILGDFIDYAKNKGYSFEIIEKE